VELPEQPAKLEKNQSARSSSSKAAAKSPSPKAADLKKVNSNQSA